MSSIRFITPEKKYAASFAEALREGLYLQEVQPEEIMRIEGDFDGWLRDANDLELPVTLPDGRQARRVPHTTLWLVDDERFLGRVGIRHALSETLKTYGGHIGYAVRKSERGKGYGRLLLAEGLRVARGIGLQKVLLTCNDDNAGSIKIIEGAGGVMTDKISLPDRSVAHRLYWIDLDK